MPIHVEINIAAPLDELWAKTQTPDLHNRWDLRFTQIHYLPRPDPDQPQQFLYETRLGFGLRIAGTGSTSDSRSASDGSRSSALQFESADWKSLIQQGSGYWQYAPHSGAVQFRTEYDYTPRYGKVGWLLDRMLFRPLMAWATAWSFDRLRLWLERGIDPAMALSQAWIYTICRLSATFVWIYHGLVPKLLLHHADEQALLRASGVPAAQLVPAMTLVGVLEIMWGLTHLVLWRSRKVLVGNLVLMPLAVVPVVLTAPEYLGAAFNPVTLNLLVMAVSLAAWLAWPQTPFAGRCRWGWLRRRQQGREVSL